MKCDSCGKKTKVFALMVRLEGKSRDMKHSLGKYTINKFYSFCYECILDKLDTKVG